jgi:hypothetical protein
METHVRVLGILHIVLSSLGILAALIVLLVFGGIAGVVGATGDADAVSAIPILGTIGGIIAAVVLALSVPGIIAGVGLLQHREWARILTIVLSALDLINVPFGTALGIYGLWVLLQARTIPLFQRRQFAAYR